MSKTVKQLGTTLFSNIVTKPVFKGKPSDKFEFTVTLTPEQAADAESNGLGITRKEYQGQEQITAKFKSKFQLIKNKVVDRKKQPYVNVEGELQEIPRGSLVAVYCVCKPYEMLGKEGITNYLSAIQVIEENSDVEFEDYEDDSEAEDFDPEF